MAIDSSFFSFFDGMQLTHDRDELVDIFTLYHGCTKCHDYSMLFGGVELVIDGKIYAINSEEEFEIVKECFTKHFNKYHKDLIKEPRKLENIEYKAYDVDKFARVLKEDGTYYNIPVGGLNLG